MLCKIDPKIKLKYYLLLRMWNDQIVTSREETSELLQASQITEWCNSMQRAPPSTLCGFSLPLWSQSLAVWEAELCDGGG